MTHYILCIPRVSITTSENDVINVLNDINIIKINFVKIIYKHRKNFNTVIIDFSDFTNNENGNFVKDLYLKNRDFKVIHDFPWFWKIMPYKKNV
jgi:hypothetical protein